MEDLNFKSKLPTVVIVTACLVGLALVLYLGILTRNKLREYDYIGRPSEQLYTITIDGEGKVTAIPDVATLSLGVQTDKPTVKEAQQENTNRINSIVESLKEVGVEPKDIKTENYNVYPRYDWTDNRQILRGYTVTQSLAVKIRDLDSVGAVLDKSATLGANQVSGLNFTIDEPEVLKEQAREKALAQAKEKAETLARIAGVKLGRLVTFSESTSGGYPIYLRNEGIKAVPTADNSAAPDVQPGSQDVIVNVTVTYEIL